MPNALRSSTWANGTGNPRRISCLFAYRLLLPHNGSEASLMRTVC